MRTCGARARIARRSRRDIRVTFRSTWAIIAGCGPRTDLVRFADPITAFRCTSANATTPASAIASAVHDLYSAGDRLPVRASCS